MSAVAAPVLEAAPAAQPAPALPAHANEPVEPPAPIATARVDVTVGDPVERPAIPRDANVESRATKAAVSAYTARIEPSSRTTIEPVPAERPAAPAVPVTVPERNSAANAPALRPDVPPPATEVPATEVPAANAGVVAAPDPASSAAAEAAIDVAGLAIRTAFPGGSIRARQAVRGAIETRAASPAAAKAARHDAVREALGSAVNETIGHHVATRVRAAVDVPVPFHREPAAPAPAPRTEPPPQPEPPRSVETPPPAVEDAHLAPVAARAIATPSAASGAAAVVAHASSGAPSPSAAMPAAARVDLGRTVESILERLAAAPASGTANLVLDPPELGRVMARFTRRGDQLKVQLVVDSPEVAAVLKQELPRLQSSLGGGSTSVEVHVGGDAWPRGQGNAGAGNATDADGRGQQNGRPPANQEPRASYRAPLAAALAAPRTSRGGLDILT